MVFDMRLRAKHGLAAIKPGEKITATYGSFMFIGSTDRLLVIHFAPPSCLRVLHPIYDRENPLLPDELFAALPLSNLGVIEAYSSPPASQEAEIFAKEEEYGWCEYFQQADLARQLENWQEVVSIGEIALQLPDAPRNETELVPFIQGYAHLGLWERAQELTIKAVQRHTRSIPMLCSTWAELEKVTPSSPEKAWALLTVKTQLGCSTSSETRDR